jgi:IS5 family transposase
MSTTAIELGASTSKHKLTIFQNHNRKGSALHTNIRNACPHTAKENKEWLTGSHGEDAEKQGHGPRVARQRRKGRAVNVQSSSALNSVCNGTSEKGALSQTPCFEKTPFAAAKRAWMKTSYNR